MTVPGRRRRSPLARSVSGWRRLRPLLGDRTGPVLVLAVASVGAGLAEAGVLALVAQVSAAMVAGADQVRAGLGPLSVDLGLGPTLFVALGLAVLRLVLQLTVAWLPSRISADVQARLRRELFASFSRASWSVQSQEREGQLQELMSNQVTQATQAVLNVAVALSGAAMFAALTVSAFVVNVPVAVLVLVSAIVLFALLRPLNRRGRTAAADLSRAEIDHASGVSESARLAEEAQVFGTAAANRHRVGELVEVARDAYYRFQLTGRMAQTLYQGLVFLLVVGGLGGLYVTGAGNLASLGAAVLMLVRAATYGQQMQGAYHALGQVLSYLDRLEGAIQRYRESTPADGDRPLPAIRSIAFDQAGYAYHSGRPVLHEVSFSVQAGEAIGIVGPSGAGKSTLVQLLLRLREPRAGAYLINGEPAQGFSRTDWQRCVAYVPQEPQLLQATVADNIRFFRDLDDAAVRRAAELAHIHDEIMAMSDGCDTVIGNRADAVSGGQRQRLCLARALAGRPDVLVLDEPTSSLDLRSEAAVQESLAALHGVVTMFIIAHRLSTISICDRVLVLADGRVEGFAPVHELEQTNDFYRHVAALTERSA